MSGACELTQLATLLQGHGLTATVQIEEPWVLVANPISSSLHEDIRCEGDHYVTGWGYAIGHVGQESAAADRLAFLLVVPSGLTRSVER